jgi:HSP20 family protein
MMSRCAVPFSRRPAAVMFSSPIDDVLDQVLRSGPSQSLGSVDTLPGPTRVAACDIVESDTEFVLTMDVPGMDMDSIDLTLNDAELTVSGERRITSAENAAQRHSERATGQFRRTFRFGQPLDVAGVRATLDRGELTVVLPKSASTRARKINIQAARPAPAAQA